MTTIFDIRSDDGTLVRLAKLPSGGATVEAFIRGAWERVNVPAGKVMTLPTASAAELRAAGLVPKPEPV